MSALIPTDALRDRGALVELAVNVLRPNPRQPFCANDAAIAQEPPDALALIVEAEAFEKDQPAMALTLKQ